MRSSRSVVEYLRELGAEPVMCPVGHSFAKSLLRERDGLYGGELAGHYYFREHYYCDSALMAALLVLGILAREARPLSELIGRHPPLPLLRGDQLPRARQGPDHRAGARRPTAAGALSELDGIRLDYPSWWFNLRKSNTEPLSAPGGGGLHPAGAGGEASGS